MKKGNSLLRGTGIFVSITTLTILILSFGVQGVQQVPDPKAEIQPDLVRSDLVRSDVIIIDTLKTFGKLERSPVVFLHGKHTEALAKQNQDCSVCHLSDEKNRRSYKYKRIKDTEKQTVMDLYHNGCITCHKETKAAGRKSGPLTCGACHQDDPQVVSDRRPMGMDKSLHYRHTKTLEDKCEKCHHVYNQQTKALEYVKGQEAACRFCHGDVTVENRIDARQAYHQACVGCHQERLAQKQTAGPDMCVRCHDPEEQKLIGVVEDVPRMKAGQPDVVFIKRFPGQEPQSNPEGETLMNRVPFNHKAHEEFNDNCRVCHHTNTKACVSCHTLKGDETGKQVQLEQSMHQPTASQSCVGCHSTQQEQPQCAGCHSSANRKLTGVNDAAACRTCHMTPLEPSANPALQPDDQAQLAALLESRPKVSGTYPVDKIPEKVEIKALSNQYQPAQMPHRKMVQSLEQRIANSKLAAVFHREPSALCQGCHHNSPIEQKPPKCNSCHGQPFIERQPARPGMMAAYHQQCIGCHTSMGLEKPVATDCTVCHAKK
jgi:hypothetical protein